MIEIDFDKADRLGSNIGKLSSSCSAIISASNSIDAGRVSSFSPGAAGVVESIKSSVNGISDLLSTYQSDYTSSIAAYRAAYEEMQNGVNNVENINTTTSNKTSKNGDVPYTILGTAYNGKMLRVNYNGREYYIINSRRLPFEYQKHILNEGITEKANNYALDDNCKTLAKIYAFDLISYKPNPHTLNTMSAYNASGRFHKIKTSANLGDIYQYLYDEAINGRPTCPEVTGGSAGHTITAFGFATSVSGPEDLNEDNILCIDNWDGEVGTMTELGRAMDYKNNKYYEIAGATDKYLAELDDYYSKNPGVPRSYVL